MNKWYIVSIRLTRELPDGTLKRVVEKYLFNAISFTDVEARVHKEIGEKIRGEFFIRSIQKTDYAEILDFKDCESWFKVKVTCATEDSDTGKEGKLTSNFLVSAKDVKQAPMRVEEKLKGMMATYKIESVIAVSLEGVFPFEETDDSEGFEDIEIKGSFAKKAIPISIPLVANNRETAIKEIDAIVGSDFKSKDDKAFYLVLQRGDCGCELKFKNREDVPENTVLCDEHGNPMIVYTDDTPHFKSKKKSNELK
jgi:hypothetical protein